MTFTLSSSLYFFLTHSEAHTPGRAAVYLTHSLWWRELIVPALWVKISMLRILCFFPVWKRTSRSGRVIKQSQVLTPILTTALCVSCHSFIPLLEHLDGVTMPWTSGDIKSTNARRWTSWVVVSFASRWQRFHSLLHWSLDQLLLWPFTLVWFPTPSFQLFFHQRQHKPQKIT